MVLQIGVIFSAAAHCKKAVETVRNAQRVPADAAHLWTVLSAVQPSLALLIRLLSRSATRPLVGGTVTVVLDVLEECEDLVVVEPPEDQPWESWWTTAPKSAAVAVSRMQRLPRVMERLREAMMLMQLTLSTTTVQAPRALESPVAVSPSDIDGARDIFHLFEQGRLSTDSYQLCHGRMHVGDDTRSNDAAVMLHQVNGEVGAAGPRYELLFVDIETVRTNPSSTAKGPLLVASLHRVPLFESTRVSRRSCAEHGALPIVTYTVGPDIGVDFEPCVRPGQFCHFPAGERYRHVTVEIFDVVLTAARLLAAEQKGFVDEVLPVDPPIAELMRNAIKVVP